MSDSPRPVQRRRKRDSTLQAVDLLNGLMDTNTQRTASGANRPGPATPRPSRRLTYSVRRDATDMIDEVGPVSQTVPQRPRHAHPIEVTPRRSLRFSKPVPDGSTGDGSDQMLQPPKSPESKHESGDQSDEPGEVQSLEKAEEGLGDNTHVISPRPSSEEYSSSDAERDNEGDHISSQNDEEMLDGEDLASEVELFSNNDGDAHQSTGRPSPPPSSSQETPGRKPKTQPGSDIASEPTLVASNEDTSNDQWRDASEQPADRRDSSRSDASATKRLPTIAVEISTATPLSSNISKTVDHQADGPSRDNETRTLEQEANVVGTTQHNDPPYQPSEASSSSVPSPEPSSSKDDLQHHSAEASPRSSDPPRQSTKRRHSTTSSQGTARVQNIEPEHSTSTARQQASSFIPRESPADDPQRSREANHRGERHATEVASPGAIARSATQDGPTQENPDQQSHGAERPEDSAWFKEASELDSQGSNWKKVIQSMHPRNIAFNVKKVDVEFEPLKCELSSLIQAYKGIIEYLASDIGPPEYDVRSCSEMLETVDRQGRRQLEKAYTLSTQGDEVGGRALVEEFEIQIFPLLVRLVLVCFEAYYVDHRLFPEAYGHFQHAMRVLLGRCNQIGGLVRGKYVACRAVSPGLRLPLKRLLESLENGRLKKGHRRNDVEVDRHAKAPTRTAKQGQSKPTKPTTPAQAWTDEEGYALVEGLQRFQGKFQAHLLGRKEGAARHAHKMHLGPDRYYQICEFYHDGIGQRGEREVREQSERLYHQMLPQIREMARRGEDHWDWGWLLKVE
ncbi:uncharacterized protein AKAW2_80507A [Aspergillus luchuensis]|uniref:Uncharacterized protein n=1 Tax=Aspergillus kawachii TaxID=1069201 RepID=A0A146F984_ASPKA|nr:uncharacterized protein AKAW2_80507A [Aspergillus luchuensis]BCS04706.1 hypothetical protein AKAW2_80507A [Aspergillus luchuensis]GAA83728.1 hypothetical protein AKAW_01843 [Aspergillus luchuensis IFO 4308]GAT22525.1 hypothetical protein RIB2604_01505610 [Aspergillus luchuensis]